jgi:lysophospholipase L1-like esterase
MNGILENNQQIKLNIEYSKNPDDFDGGVFAHWAIGENMDPTSKLNDFKKIIENNQKNGLDYAFMKFCYVDIDREVVVEKIFKQYKDVHDQLKKMYPGIKFIHLTAPLTSKRSDIKTFMKNIAKKILGRPVRTYMDNIYRNKFNEMLKREYEDNSAIFDLASLESTTMNGSALRYKGKDVLFPSMVPSYTYDGGHLNEEGRRFIAEQFLIFLAELADK